MKKISKKTSWIIFGVGMGILGIGGLAFTAYTVYSITSVFIPTPKDPLTYREHLLTNEKIKYVGYDQKAVITLEDLNKYFPNINTIDKEAFKDNKILTTIQIPKNIDYINKSAFENSNLHTIEFEQGGKLYEIESNAFKNTKIKTIDLPDSTKYIGPNVFQNTLIESFSFPHNIYGIGDSAFEGCLLLKEVSCIKGYPKYMGSRIFKDTNIKNYSYLDLIGSGAVFAFNNSLQHVDFSHATIISESFFINLLSEIDIVIPNNIIKIGAFAFADSKIKTLKFENYNTNNDRIIIESSAFINCINLKKLVLPNISYISLDNNAFSYTHFNDITMPLYLKQNSKIPLYGFTPAQWSVINWI